MTDELCIRDLNDDGMGIFTMLEFSLPFIKDGFLHDEAFIGLYGDRRLSKFTKSIIGEEVSYSSLNKLSVVIATMFGSEWERYYKELAREFPEYTYEKLITESVIDKGLVKQESESTTEDEEMEQVSAYNSDVMVDDTKGGKKTTDSGHQHTNNDNDRQREYSEKGNTGGIDDRIRVINHLNNRVGYEKMYKELVRVLAILIY